MKWLEVWKRNVDFHAELQFLRRVMIYNTSSRHEKLTSQTSINITVRMNDMVLHGEEGASKYSNCPAMVLPVLRVSERMYY
jgi:hypothetical protein